MTTSITVKSAEAARASSTYPSLASDSYCPSHCKCHLTWRTAAGDGRVGLSRDAYSTKHFYTLHGRGWFCTEINRSHQTVCKSSELRVEKLSIPQINMAGTKGQRWCLRGKISFSKVSVGLLLHNNAMKPINHKQKTQSSIQGIMTGKFLNSLVTLRNCSSWGFPSSQTCSRVCFKSLPGAWR